MKFLVGKKTFLIMGFALIVGLVQHFTGPLPNIDPEVWSIVLPTVGLLLRFVTHQPVSIKDILEALKGINDGRKLYNKSTSDSNQDK